MKSGRAFNIIWWAVVLVMLLKDFWLGLGASGGQIFTVVFVLIVVGLFIGAFGLVEGLKASEDQATSKTKSRRKRGEGA